MRHSYIIEAEIEDLNDWLNDKENAEGWEKAIRKDIRVLEEELAEALDYEDWDENWERNWRLLKWEECA